MPNYGRQETTPAPFIPIGDHVQISDLSSVSTPTRPAGALAVMATATGADVRFTLDGATDPTATVGHVLRDGETVIVDVAEAAELRAIQAEAGASLDLQWGSF